MLGEPRPIHRCAMRHLIVQPIAVALHQDVVSPSHPLETVARTCPEAPVGDCVVEEERPVDARVPHCHPDGCAGRVKRLLLYLVWILGEKRTKATVVAIYATIEVRSVRSNVSGRPECVLVLRE